MDCIERIAGCLLGGAVGDALGAPVEFMSLSEIRAKFGNEGIEHYALAYGRIGAITDDTQMTLFTLEGMLKAYIQGDTTSLTESVRIAYLRWLGTQGIRSKSESLSSIYGGWLWSQKLLHSRRAPGNSCLSSLQMHLSCLESNHSEIPSDPINNSKGCGGVMRMAPVGFFDLDCFKTGCELAMLTHGHPSGYLASGFLAQLIHELIQGISLSSAIESTRELLLQWPSHQEVLQAVDQALDYAKSDVPTPETLEKLGEGWVAEEALALSLFCALKAKNFAHGVRLAVNHSGDSDSTGAITGNILGTLWGQQSIPDEYLQDLELRSVIEQMVRHVVDLDYDDCRDRYSGL
ncbi:MAG: ADP-ribosylglycohydrolase family protein [bacterium]